MLNEPDKKTILSNTGADGACQSFQVIVEEIDITTKVRHVPRRKFDNLEKIMVQGKLED